jgi:hypothetical protein
MKDEIREFLANKKLKGEGGCVLKYTIICQKTNTNNPHLCRTAKKLPKK